jgi:hypothetical protein
MSGEACGLWVEVWISIVSEELPRLSRAIANIRALEPNHLTDAERELVRSVSENAMVGDATALLTSQSVSETEFCKQMLANAEGVREKTRRADREIERIAAGKGL